MDEKLAVIVFSTLTTGSTYALIAVGFVILFRATQVVSFAQGAFLLVGAEVFSDLIAHTGWPAIACLLVSVAALGVLGGLTYLAAFRRLTGVDPIFIAVATIGLGTVIEVVSEMIWGTNGITIPQLYSGNQQKIAGWLYETPAGLAALVAAVVVYAAALAVLYGTRIGLRMRAAADNPGLSAYKGINVERVSLMAWAAAAGTAAIGGAVFLLGTQPVPSTVYSLGLVAFPAIFLGGADSIVGAALGSLIIAFIQSVVVVQLGGQWQDAVSYAVLLGILLLRPQGILGRFEVSRL
jgi:branched-chain amino acid transport system permease protein